MKTKLPIQSNHLILVPESRWLSVYYLRSLENSHTNHCHKFIFQTRSWFLVEIRILRELGSSDRYTWLLGGKSENGWNNILNVFYKILVICKMLTMGEKIIKNIGTNRAKIDFSLLLKRPCKDHEKLCGCHGTCL
jgi:hypothetical protein